MFPCIYVCRVQLGGPIVLYSFRPFGHLFASTQPVWLVQTRKRIVDYIYARKFNLYNLIIIIALKKIYRKKFVKIYLNLNKKNLIN